MSPTLAPFLAHAGAGASWQAVVTIVALGFVVLFVAAVAGRLTLDEPGDLVLPIASIAILAGLATAVSEIISDWIPWALPLGIAAIAALVVAATTRWALTPRSPVTWVTVVVAAATAIAFYAPLRQALHPPPDATATAQQQP